MSDGDYQEVELLSFLVAFFEEISVCVFFCQFRISGCSRLTRIAFRKALSVISEQSNSEVAETRVHRHHLVLAFGIFVRLLMPC